MPAYLVELDDGRKFRVEADAPPTSEEVLSYLQAPAATPNTDQPGRLGSFASSVGRGALSIVPGTIGGIGYATGSDTLTEAADTIEGGINRMLPVNPEYQDEFLMKAGGALGQAGGMLATGGITGAVGKGLAASRGLQAAQAAAKGTQLAQNVMLGTGVAQGVRGGGQAAEQYGMQGGTAYARALLGGAIEGASERYLFGLGTELAPIKKLLGDAAEKGVGGIVKAAGTEAGEEAVAQVGGNLATTALAPYGVQTPGAFAGAGEAALLGGVAGGALGGFNALLPSPTIEGEAMVPFEQAPAAPETEAQDELGVAAFQQEIAQIAQEPDPIEPLQQAVNKAAETSVAANVELLPATAAALAATAPAPALAPALAPAPATPTDPAEIHRKRNAEAKTLMVYDSEGLVDRKATQEKRDAAAKAAGMTREAWEYEQAALGQKAKEDFFAALNEGDTLEWTDLNGRKGTGIVEIGLDGRKVVRNTTEESPAEGEAYGAQSGVFGQVADALKVTKAAPRKQRAGSPAPVEQLAPAPKETMDQVRARMRQRLSAEERATMEQNLAQMEDEGVLADVFVEERQRASQRDDVARRQREFENERQRFEDQGILGDVFAEERQRATAREQQRQQPPVVKETVAPIQPVPAVEETVAAQSSEEDNQKALLNDLQIAEADYRDAEQKAQDADELFFTERDKYDTRKNKPRNYTFVGPKEQQERLMALANDAFKARRFANDVAQDLGKARKNVAPAAQADTLDGEVDEITRQDIQKAQSKFLQFRGKSVGAGLTHMVKFPDGKVRKVTPFEWDRLNAPDETSESTVSLINENKIAKLTRHQSEQYGRYRFEAKRKGFNPSKAQVGETLDLLKKLNPPEGVTVYLRRLGRLDLLEPIQPVPAVEETVAAQTESAPEEAPDRLMDVPQAMQFLYSKGLTKTDREKAQKLIEKNEREARKIGKIQGARSFYESEIDAAVEEVMAQKHSSSEFRRTLEKARANKEASQELSTLVDALDVAEATLKEIESDRGMFGVQWAEKNVRRRTTMQKAKIRDLKERIVALAPVKKSKTDAKPLLSRSERRALEEKEKAASTPGIVPNVEITVDEPGAAEVGLGMEKPQTQNPYRTKVSDTEDFDFLDRLGVTDPPKDAETIPAGPLPEGTFTFRVGPGYNGNPPSRYAITPDGKIYSDSNRTMTHGGASPWVLDYVVRGSRSDTSASTPANPPVQRDVTKPEQMTPEEYSSSERDTELPKNYVLSDGNGNFVTEEKNGWFKVWRLTGTHATLAGTVGFKGVEGLTKAKTRLKEVSAEMHEEKLKDGLRTKRPVSTAAVDAYGITLPEGYVQDGELYVYRPEASQPAPAAKPPEQMTPEEYVEAKKPELEDVAILEREFNALPKDSNRRPRAERAIRSAREDNKAKEQQWEENRGMWDRKHRRSVGDAMESNLPVSKAAVDAYGITLPEGYVQDGELYVYRPSGTVAPKTELAQVGDEVTWMAAGKEARGTVYAVRGDVADIDYFGPKTVPLSELSIVRKSSRRLAQEKREAESTATTAQKKPQEPEQPKQKSKFTKAEVASLEQGKTPEGWTVSSKEPVTVTDTKGKTWEVKMQFSPTRTMTLAGGGEVQTFDVQTAPQPKPAAEVETPVAGVPVELPDPATLTNAQINKEKAALTKKRDSITDRMIAADRGSEVSSETMKKTDPLSKEFQEVTRRFQDLSNEAEMRMGSRVYGDLPTDKSWKSYRRKKPEDFGSTNTVVTKETKDQAVKSLRKKIGGQTNVGLDPSILKDAIAIGAFYLEGGVRGFAEFSAKMIEDFGAGVQKYIRPAYEALRKRTDIDTAGMDPEESGEQTILPEYENRRKQFQRDVRRPESLADVPDYVQAFLGKVFGIPSTRSTFAGAKFDGQTPFSVQTTDRAEFTVGLGLNPQVQKVFETQDREVFTELLLDTVTEEMIHLADFNALKEIWVSEGNSGDFNNWVASRSAATLVELQQAGFGDIVQSAWALYEDTNLANLSQKEITLLLSSNPFAAQGVVSEAARMAVQLRLKRDITETGWLKVKKAISEWLSDLLSGLKKALARSRDSESKTLFQARIDSIESKFASFLKEGGETAPKVEEPKTPPPPAPKAEEPKAAPAQEAPKAAPAVAAEPATVPIANDPVDAQRVALGLPPIMRQTQEAYTFPQMWADAESAMAANPKRGETLVDELNDKPRTISALEDAILLRERVNRVNALDLAMVEFNKAPKGNNEQQRKAMDTAITELTKLDDALNVAGTEQGRSLNARKMLARQDYTLAKMITTLRAANDGDLSEDDVAMVTRLQKQIAEAQAKLAEVESGQAARVAEAEKVAFEAGRQEVLQEIEDRAKADAAKIAEMQKRRAEHQAAKKEAAAKPNKWAEIREAARARNAELRSNLYSDVVLVKAASMAVNDVIIGATYIAEGVTKLADWVTSMRGEGYNLSDKEMEQLFNESKAFDAGEELPAAETPLKTRKAKAPAIDKVKAIAADEEALDSRTIYEMVVEKMKARAESSQGAKLPEMSEADLTSVIREVTADVQQYFPDITEREVRDLFSGYGKILQPSQDELAKQIRQLSALGKLASAIEDAKAKIAPLKSGPQRDKATQAIRLQQKKLARELRMSGLEYAAGEGQLRSPLDAIKARLNNQINDLALEINQRQKIKKRPSVDYDRETEALVTLRDDLKRISDEVNKPAGPTLEETVAEEMKKIDKRILELQKLIAENKFKPKEDTLLHTAELDAKRDVRDGLNKTLAKLRKEAADKLRTQDDIDKDAIESAQESIAELEKKIAAKDVSRPQRRTPTETAEYQALIEKKKSLQQVLSKLRESIEGKRQMSGEQRIKAATKALDASIARMTGMITSGKFDVIKRTPKTPDTPELKAKREARNNLRKRILELRKLKRDAGIDPIAKQISTDKKRIQTRMKKLKERLDKGDFSKPVKKKRATDQALLDLQIEEEKLKEQWAKTVFERQLASRGPGKRLLDATQQTLNTARAILTSVDVSAVLRQGGFIVLGNPMRGFRNLAPMFKAFASDEFAKGEKFRLANRENYKNGLYQQSKLFLADTSRIDQMSKQEEAFMTRWLEKIPRALGGGVLRGSQRAYTVFLNRLRADSFDAMVGNLKKGSEPTPEEIKAVADYINIATGRGDLGKFNQAGTMLNTVFFAPRLVASRFQILAGYPYLTASGRTKALVLREYAKFLAGAAVVYALGSLAQDDDDEPIETDPRSSDFLKIRFGDTRVDPLSGLIQATVLLSRLASGEKKQASGKIVPIRGADVPYGADDSFDVMGNFVRTKFSPIVGSAVNVVTGKNVVGEPTDVTEELKRMVIPMSLMEMKETLEAQGVPEATALIMLQLFGMGVQTYTPGKK